jgi:hypothetical protein
MDLKSPMFDKLRIRRSEAEERARQAPRCQHPGCDAAGEFRAPMGRNREGSFLLFCMPHVQEYNRSYDYFKGMTDDAVQAFQRDAITGHRPTWKIGATAKAGQRGEDSGIDPLGLDREAAARRAEAKASEQRKRYGKIALKALDILHLDENATPETIRAKYKAWVKQLHPDANQGDRSREDKLREIIKAYNQLKSAGHV